MDDARPRPTPRRDTVGVQLQESAMKATGPGFDRFSPGAVGLVTLLALALAPAALAAAGTPAEAASLECKSLLGQRNYTAALARCEESVRLDPKLPEPHYLLGATHD